MPSQQDRHIFITGIVGRAMGSGKFTVQEIRPLAEAAADAFDQVFGEVVTPAAQPASVGPAKAFGEVANQVLSEASSSLASYFNSWADQKSWLYGPAKEKTWRELLDYAIESNQNAIKALTSGSNQDLSKSDPQYLDRNRERVEKCKAVLAMARADARSEGESLRSCPF